MKIPGDTVAYQGEKINLVMKKHKKRSLDTKCSEGGRLPVCEVVTGPLLVPENCVGMTVNIYPLHTSGVDPCHNKCIDETNYIVNVEPIPTYDDNANKIQHMTNQSQIQQKGSNVAYLNASWKPVASDNTKKRSKQSRVSSVSTFMSSCCMLLTNAYQVKVNVPVRLLLVLVERILMVNGALPEMSLPFMTARQQENICSELPVLHIYSLELLAAIIKATGSKPLPHAASIVRLITKYFKTCELPDIRIKVYSVAKILLISMGVGMALCLSKEVVDNDIAAIPYETNSDDDEGYSVWVDWCRFNILIHCRWNIGG